MIQQLILLGVFSLMLGCGFITSKSMDINPEAPLGSTRTITITKINPVFYSGETIILATDKNHKEIHYEVHHTDISIISSAIAVLAGYALGSS